MGGFTGSGKVSFAFVGGGFGCSRHDPSRLNFILVDFKVVLRLRRVERLPHTIGSLSNFDAPLAHRAIESLEAEMDRRQRLLRPLVRAWTTLRIIWRRTLRSRCLACCFGD